MYSDIMTKAIEAEAQSRIIRQTDYKYLQAVLAYFGWNYYFLCDGGWSMMTEEVRNAITERDLSKRDLIVFDYPNRIIYMDHNRKAE